MHFLVVNMSQEKRFYQYTAELVFDPVEFCKSLTTTPDATQNGVLNRVLVSNALEKMEFFLHVVSETPEDKRSYLLSTACTYFPVCSLVPKGLHPCIVFDCPKSCLPNVGFYEWRRNPTGHLPCCKCIKECHEQHSSRNCVRCLIYHFTEFEKIVECNENITGCTQNKD